MQDCHRWNVWHWSVLELWLRPRDRRSCRCFNLIHYRRYRGIRVSLPQFDRQLGGFNRVHRTLCAVSELAAYAPISVSSFSVSGARVC